MSRSFKTFRPVVTAIAMASIFSAAHAGERESLEALRQTTVGLIEALVQKGVISREAADAMLRKASQDGAASGAPQGATADAQPAKPVQRVPYVSETMKAQLRNEVREEVLAQARQERWGVPNAPTWVDRIRIDGDFRVRYQLDRAASGNTAPTDYLGAEVQDVGRISRAPDFAAYALDSTGTPLAAASTQDDRNRERIRLRLGLTAKVSDEVGVGVRLATGNATDRVSTNQTLGQNFNKYQLFVDRAFVKYEPVNWLNIKAGRIPNPWFNSDMVWSENLNFEGIASTASWESPDQRWSPFVTMGWFPIREESAGVRSRRALSGLQLGSQIQAGDRTRVKLGVGYYQYYNLEGRADDSYVDDGTGNFVGNPLTAGRYEYPSGLRQKGNTVFETQPADPATRKLDPKWGLAYRFAPLTLTASAEFTHFSPFTLLVSAEYVYNTAFNVSDFQKRAGAAFAGVNPGGRRDGYQLKMALGSAEVRELHDWQVSVMYRHLGSDAVLDAFNDSDLGLGGTNVKGYALGFTYGVSHNTTLGARYLSSKSIDPTINRLLPSSSYGVNSLQVDFNVRF